MINLVIKPKMTKVDANVKKVDLNLHNAATLEFLGTAATRQFRFYSNAEKWIKSESKMLEKSLSKLRQDKETPAPAPTCEVCKGNSDVDPESELQQIDGQMLCESCADLAFLEFIHGDIDWTN